MNQAPPPTMLEYISRVATPKLVSRTNILRIAEPTFGPEFHFQVPVSHIIQNHWKYQLYNELFSFNLTVKYVQLYNFRLWNCLWTRNASRLVAWKVFLFQMLGEILYLHCQAKCHFDKKCQHDVLRGNMNMDVSPYILKFKFYKNTCSTMIACIHVGLL